MIINLFLLFVVLFIGLKLIVSESVGLLACAIGYVMLGSVAVVFYGGIFLAMLK